MLTKDQLLAALREGVKIEEKAIPIYSRHINNTLFLSGFSGEKREKVAQALDVLRQDSIRHENIFLSLIKRVEGSQQDVY